MKEITKVLRTAILQDELYGEFSHRGLCTILGHANDILQQKQGKRLPANLFKKAARAWIDRLPDKENREIARKIMDPQGGTLGEGDTDHIQEGSLVEGF